MPTWYIEMFYECYRRTWIFTIRRAGTLSCGFTGGSSICCATWFTFRGQKNKSTPKGIYGENAGAGDFFLSLFKYQKLCVIKSDKCYLGSDSVNLTHTISATIVTKHFILAWRNSLPLAWKKTVLEVTKNLALASPLRNMVQITQLAVGRDIF